MSTRGWIVPSPLAKQLSFAPGLQTAAAAAAARQKKVQYMQFVSSQSIASIPGAWNRCSEKEAGTSHHSPLTTHHSPRWGSISSFSLWYGVFVFSATVHRLLLTHSALSCSSFSRSSSSPVSSTTPRPPPLISASPSPVLSLFLSFSLSLSLSLYLLSRDGRSSIPFSFLSIRSLLA